MVSYTPPHSQASLVYQKFPLISSCWDSEAKRWYIFIYEMEQYWTMTHLISSLYSMKVCLLSERNFQNISVMWKLQYSSHRKKSTSISQMYTQHKPENFCKLLQVDPESRPQNFLFILWIVKCSQRRSYLWTKTTTTTP